jgi:hypothetical protein
MSRLPLRQTLERVRRIALQSKVAPLSMGEIVKLVDTALGEETPLPDWMKAKVKEDPLTATELADALDAFWNASLGEAQNQREGHATASIMSEGFAAVARKLRGE